ncbi:HNH endonuclease signature motif containing protein [Pantoea sp. GD03673]|uniref:HNH endonuclease n=1 Tax=Pantoea sp. GD03673 TaxID=2975364 RepID=UPI00244BF84A|nr:HNH endonuclease signature motif containing protein [Pantoea sp. GD03673]MDH2066881.1 HNH endonuclease [Pantoea sp. GD03673]
MPQRIPRACRKHGCAKTTTDRSGYCADHLNEGWQQHQNGLSRHQRVYGSGWDDRRARTLNRDKYLCQNCNRNGRAAAAKAVDHIMPKAHGSTDEDSNPEGLCWPCHKNKTARERLK